MIKIFKNITRSSEKDIINYLISINASKELPISRVIRSKEVQDEIVIDNHNDLKSFCKYLNKKGYNDFLNAFFLSNYFIDCKRTVESYLTKGNKGVKDFKKIISLLIEYSIEALSISIKEFGGFQKGYHEVGQKIIAWYLKENFSLQNFKKLAFCLDIKYFNKRKLKDFILSSMDESSMPHFMAKFGFLDKNINKDYVCSMQKVLLELDNERWLSRSERINLERTCSTLAKMKVPFSSLKKYSHKIRGRLYIAYIKNNMLDEKLSFTISRDKTSSYAYEVSKHICENIGKYENSESLLMPFIKCNNDDALRSFAHNLDLKYMHIIIANKIIRNGHSYILNRRKKEEKK